MDSKRMMLMVAAIAGIVLLLTFNSQKPEKGDEPVEADPAATQPAEAAPAEAADPAETPAETPTETADSPTTADDAPAETPVVAAAPDHHQWIGSDQSGGEKTVFLGSLDPEGDYRMQVELTSKGASVKAARLRDHFVTSADRRLYNEDPEGYEQARLADPDTYKGRYELLTPTSRQMAMATRGVRLEMISDNLEAIEAGELNATAFDNQLWVISKADAGSATFTYMIYLRRPDGTSQEALRLDKTYRLDPDSYSLSVSYELSNLTDVPLRVSVDQLGATGLEREDSRMDNRHTVYGRLSVEDQTVQVKLESYKKLNDPESKSGRILGTSESSEPVVWAGMTNKYFASLIYLAPEAGESLDSPSWQADFYVQPASSGDEPERYMTGVRLGGTRAGDIDGPVWGFRLRPRTTRVATFLVYTGPKDRGIFANDSHPLHRPLYARLNYLSSINFGGCFCTWTWLAFKVMWVLKGLAVVTFGNYGLAIILMVFFVRLMLHPLAKKSQISMLKMQKLGPEMKKLQAKYADDKETLNREMMKFYRENGASPLLGCLPMFLQMPIWIALYTGINASVELRHAAFLPVWITDLAAPDALLTWTNPIPLIGTTFNFLPLLLVVAMFLQMKLTPQMTQPGAAGDGANQQQKMMKYLMPMMMLVFFYQAPSGLTLYVMASTAAGALDSYLIRRHMRAKEAMEAAMETTIDVPGKAARSARPKKPKGPMWTKQ